MRVGTRVKTKNGTGTIAAVEQYRGGVNMYAVKLDDITGLDDHLREWHEAYGGLRYWKREIESLQKAQQVKTEEKK